MAIPGACFHLHPAHQEAESDDGHPLGTLCVLDYKPRELDADQLRALEILARQIMTSLELRLAAREIVEKNRELTTAMKQIKTLEGLLPICAQCKKIRDEDDSWQPVEIYIRSRTEAEFTHGICPTCAQDYMDDLERLRQR